MVLIREYTVFFCCSFGTPLHFIRCLFHLLYGPFYVAYYAFSIFFIYHVELAKTQKL